MNLVAPINSMGYGYVGLNLLKAYDVLKAEPALWPIGSVEHAAEDGPIIQAAINRTSYYDEQAPCLRVYHQFDMSLFAGRGPHIGYTFFEGDGLRPIEKHHLKALDRVAVSSKWAAQVLVENGIEQGRTCVARPGVDSSIFNAGVAPAEIPKPTQDTTVFLNVGKWEVRKGHDVLVDWFNAAFTAADDVMLVMACHNPLVFDGYDGPSQSKDWQRLYLDSPMGRAGKILCLGARLPSQQHVAALMAAADCGVFPARAEGWNLDAAEMLAMGKHCILTDYSAHTEFGAEGGALMVPVDGLETAFDGFFFRGDCGRWARLGDRAAEGFISGMRNAHAAKRAGALHANANGVRLFGESLTWENCAREILQGVVGDR